MSLLFNRIIKPKPSKVYLRLVLITYLLTALLIYYSSLYLFLQLILFGCIGISLIIEWNYQSPCKDIKTIELSGHEWVLEKRVGQEERYTQVTILICNILFSLIQLSDGFQKKRIIFFHDQLTEMELRFLHVNAKKSFIGV